jgi:hypothetical protein
MNIAVYRTTKGEHFFLDYRGRWRPIADLKKCKPKTFACGIPHRYRPSESVEMMWAEPYPDFPNLRKRGVFG